MTAHPNQKLQRTGTRNQNRVAREQVSKATTDLTALPSLSHAELKSQWTDTFDTAPPKGLSRRLMIHALAYALQARQMGQLKPSVRQELRRIANPHSSQSSTTLFRLTPGTRLMREWRGTVHVVDVTKDGLVWNGRVYSSLSAIARTITGTRWSGNRFFGLRKRSNVADTAKPALSISPSPNDTLAAAPQNDPDFVEVDQSLHPNLEPA